MQNELKPCPFCGGEVRLDVAYSYFRDVVIYCDGCDMVSLWMIASQQKNKLQKHGTGGVVMECTRCGEIKYRADIGV